MRWSTTTVFILCAMAMTVCPASAKTWNVSQDGLGDAPTISAAIDSAMDGDTILLADETFTGVGNRALNLGSKELTLTATTRATLDCEGQSRGLAVTGGQTPATVISNITILNGMSGGDGGGILISGGSDPTFDNVEVKDCTAASDGGGVWMIESGTAPTFLNCIISGCGATSGNGGGVLINSAAPTFSMCDIKSNTAVNGAGIYVMSSAARPIITDSQIRQNTASGNGGGVYIVNPFDLTITGNVFSQNNAVNGGGLFFDTTSKGTVENNTISENTATTDGSGVFYQSSSNTIHKNIIAYNTGSDGVGCSGVDPTTSCTVLWMNNPTGLNGDGVCGIAPNNIVADPLFCGVQGTFIYTIDANSPATAGNSLCGERIGAKGVDCGGVPVKPTTWGDLKSRYPR